MKFHLAIVLCSALAVVLVGCGEGDLGQQVGTNAKPDYEKQIRDIENNPNMPPKAKEVAIGTIKAHMNQAAVQSAANDKAK